MKDSALASFVRTFTLFALFISVSCGLTVAVSTYAKSQKAAESAAVAKAMMLHSASGPTQ